MVFCKAIKPYMYLRKLRTFYETDFTLKFSIFFSAPDAVIKIVTRAHTILSDPPDTRAASSSRCCDVLFRLRQSSAISVSEMNIVSVLLRRKQEPCCRMETARCHCKFRSIRSVQAVVFAFDGELTRARSRAKVLVQVEAYTGTSGASASGVLRQCAP